MHSHPSDGLRGPVASGLYFDDQFIRPFDFGADGFVVGDDVLEGVEIGGIVAPGDPEFEVAAAAVFFFEVGDCAGDVAFASEVGVVFETELDCASDDGFSVDESVGFGNELAVDAARFVFA